MCLKMISWMSNSADPHQTANAKACLSSAKNINATL